MIDGNNKQSEDLLITFIKSKTGVCVTRDSMVFDDLGIDGLDADTFMEDFSNEFDIDLSGFDIEDYCFTEYEVGNFFLTLYRLVFNRKKLKRASFRVGHLIEVINAGRWIDPN